MSWIHLLAFGKIFGRNFGDPEKDQESYIHVLFINVHFRLRKSFLRQKKDYLIIYLHQIGQKGSF